ncbi:hypothetical protein VPNG_07127 [Cytospora leucostoma]|uniref:Uncharacterized protein n=1 Tax=Cytospora leucostoma TaxID=1230097 RepID=A0A423WVN2_9PEZI|nr:hypothetical protein VPNG_07127 [Cytospora leucostoma]
MSGVGKPSDIPTGGQQQETDSAIQGGKTDINLADPAVTNAEGLGVFTECARYFPSTAEHSGPPTSAAVNPAKTLNSLYTISRSFTRHLRKVDLALGVRRGIKIMQRY